MLLSSHVQHFCPRSAKSYQELAVASSDFNCGHSPTPIQTSYPYSELYDASFEMAQGKMTCRVQKLYLSFFSLSKDKCRSMKFSPDVRPWNHRCNRAHHILFNTILQTLKYHTATFLYCLRQLRQFSGKQSDKASPAGSQRDAPCLG